MYCCVNMIDVRIYIIVVLRLLIVERGIIYLKVYMILCFVILDLLGYIKFLNGRI